MPTWSAVTTAEGFEVHEHLFLQSCNPVPPTMAIVPVATVITVPAPKTLANWTPKKPVPPWLAVTTTVGIEVQERLLTADTAVGRSNDENRDSFFTRTFIETLRFTMAFVSRPDLKQEEGVHGSNDSQLGIDDALIGGSFFVRSCGEARARTPIRY